MYNQIEYNNKIIKTILILCNRGIKKYLYVNWVSLELFKTIKYTIKKGVIFLLSNQCSILYTYFF